MLRDHQERYKQRVTFRDFDISQNVIRLEHAARIFGAFTVFDTNVERLRVFGNLGLNDDACTPLAAWLAAVKQETSPLELHLSDCAITDVGFCRLVDAFARNAAFPRGGDRPMYVR